MIGHGAWRGLSNVGASSANESAPALRNRYWSGAGYTFYSYEDLDAVYTYNNEGRIVSVTYPKGGPTYTYTLDGMGRPVQMEDDAGKIWAKEAQYDAAGRLTEVKLWEHDGYGYPKFASEQRTYNARGQLTRLKLPGYLDEEYRYPAANAGRISSKKDWISGEEMVYQYDELNRLIHAETTSAAWGLSFSCDGFGNRAAQTVTKGSAGRGRPARLRRADGGSRATPGRGAGEGGHGECEEVAVPKCGGGREPAGEDPADLRLPAGARVRFRTAVQDEIRL